MCRSTNYLWSFLYLTACMHAEESAQNKQYYYPCYMPIKPSRHSTLTLRRKAKQRQNPRYSCYASIDIHSFKWFHSLPHPVDSPPTPNSASLPLHHYYCPIRFHSPACRHRPIQIQVHHSLWIIRCYYYRASSCNILHRDHPGVDGMPWSSWQHTWLRQRRNRLPQFLVRMVWNWWFRSQGLRRFFCVVSIIMYIHIERVKHILWVIWIKCCNIQCRKRKVNNNFQ